ncbi:hypothetical protein ACLB2K_041679 [Fragaria x ananassa]
MLKPTYAVKFSKDEISKDLNNEVWKEQVEPIFEKHGLTCRMDEKGPLTPYYQSTFELCKVVGTELGAVHSSIFRLRTLQHQMQPPSKFEIQRRLVIEHF